MTVSVVRSLHDRFVMTFRVRFASVARPLHDRFTTVSWRFHDRFTSVTRPLLVLYTTVSRRFLDRGVLGVFNVSFRSAVGIDFIPRPK